MLKFFEHLGDLRLTQILSRYHSFAKWFSSASRHGTALVGVSSLHSVMFLLAFHSVSSLHGITFLHGAVFLGTE